MKMLLILLIVTISFSARANNTPALALEENYVVSVGEQFTLRVKPTDPDGSVPGIYINNIPAGASFDDNGDGSRTFAWVPDELFANREIELEFIVLDADLPNSRFSVTTTLNLESSSTSVQEEPVLVFDILDSITIARGEAFSLVVQPLSTDGLIPGVTVQTAINGARFTDNFDGTRTFTWDSPELGRFPIIFQAHHPNDPTNTVQHELILKVESLEFSMPPVIERIDVPSEIAVGASVDFRVSAMGDSGVPWLFMRNAPSNSSFIDNLDGTRNFFWTPLPDDVGETVLTFIAQDPENAELFSTAEVSIIVREPSVYTPPVFDPIETEHSIGFNTDFALDLRVTDSDGSIHTIELPEFNRHGATLVQTGDGTATFVWNSGTVPGEFNFFVFVFDNVSTVRIDFSITVMDSCENQESVFVIVSNCIAPTHGAVVTDDVVEIANVSFNDIEMLNIGDFNGDSYDDWLFPVSLFTFSNQPFEEERVLAKLLLGSSSGIPSPINVTQLAGDDVKEIIINVNEQNLREFTTVGDINADGFYDIAIIYDAEIRILFGRNMSSEQSLSGFSEDIGLVISNNQAPSGSVFTNRIGDFNGDGIDDLLYAFDHGGSLNEPGENDFLSIIYGHEALSGSIELPNITADSGRIFNFDYVFGELYEPWSMNDFDNDGFDDIGIRTFDSGNDVNYILYGQPESDEAAQTFRLMEEGSITTLVADAAAREAFRFEGGVDISGDGLSDVMIMSLNFGLFGLNANPVHGVILNGDGGRLPPFIDLSEVVASDTSIRSTQFKIPRSSLNVEQFSIMGDVNGDAVNDIVVSLPSQADTQFLAGSVNVIYGTDFGSELILDDLAVDQGRRFIGAASFHELGKPLYFLNDVNNDGFDDIFIGSNDIFESGRRTSWIVFGQEN